MSRADMRDDHADADDMSSGGDGHDGFDVFLDVAGVRDNDVEVRLLDGALIVEGRRQMPAPDGEGPAAHAAGGREGLFRVEVPLPGLADGATVDARYGLGLLRITLRKPGA